MTNKTWLLQLTDFSRYYCGNNYSISYRLKLCDNFKISPFLNKIFDWIVSQVKFKKNI